MMSGKGERLQFPILKVADIVLCLEDQDVRLTETDVSKPTAPVMTRLYEALCDMFMGVKYGEYQLSDPSFVSEIIDSNLDHPELHRDSLSWILFFRRL